MCGCAKKRLVTELETEIAQHLKDKDYQLVHAGLTDKPEVCASCGGTENVVHDHAGWGWICRSCFELPGEEIQRRIRAREHPCTVYSEYCPVHNFVHGAEAEELREGIEKILEEYPPSEYETSNALARLLDDVDARDSLAYREQRDKEEKEM